MKAKHYHYDAAQELEHIGAMIVRLEQLAHAQSGSIGWQTTALMLPDYWRERIRAITGVPPELLPHVHALMVRLDAIDALTQAALPRVRAHDNTQGR
ncbi:conserved protein of unknown function [Burkholderia multivorans]